MVDFKQRGSTWYLIYYLGGKKRTVSFETDSLHLAKAKRREFESAQLARGELIYIRYHGLRQLSLTIIDIVGYDVDGLQNRARVSLIRHLSRNNRDISWLHLLR